MKSYTIRLVKFLRVLQLTHQLSENCLLESFFWILQKLEILSYQFHILRVELCLNIMIFGVWELNEANVLICEAQWNITCSWCISIPAAAAVASFFHIIPADIRGLDHCEPSFSHWGFVLLPHPWIVHLSSGCWVGWQRLPAVPGSTSCSDFLSWGLQSSAVTLELAFPRMMVCQRTYKYQHVDLMWNFYWAGKESRKLIPLDGFAWSTLSTIRCGEKSNWPVIPLQSTGDFALQWSQSSLCLVFSAPSADLRFYRVYYSTKGGFHAQGVCRVEAQKEIVCSFVLQEVLMQASRLHLRRIRAQTDVCSADSLGAH